MEPLQDIERAFCNWDKWATYSVAFRYMDEKKVRLSEIQDIATRHGIAPSVINSRRRQWVLLNASKMGGTIATAHNKLASTI